jgi:hypothetical protein
VVASDTLATIPTLVRNLQYSCQRRNNVNRVQMISYKTARIVSLDFSRCKAEELPPIVQEAKALIARQPRGSALVLTNVTGTETNKTVSQLMKELTTHNKPFVKASAVVGVDGLKKILFNAVQRVSGRHLSSFDTVGQAMAWLTNPGATRRRDRSRRRAHGPGDRDRHH